MPKKQKKLIIPKFAGYFDIIGWLNDQAHSGTEQSIKILKDFIAKEKDERLKGHARCALEEAEYFYYCANNEQEEKDFLLAKMIRNKDEQIFDLEMKAEAVKLELEKLELDKKVHQQLLKKLDKKQAEEWKYNVSEDYAFGVRKELADFNDGIAYLEAWIKQARHMIKTSRYKNIPAEIIDHIHLDSEASSCCEDDEADCDCNCHNNGDDFRLN